MKGRTLIAMGMVLALATGALWPVEASFFESASFQEFGKGKLTGVVNAESGVLTLAAEKKELLKVEGDYVWSMAVGPKGVIYAGTSDRGSVYRLEGGKSERLIQLDDDAAVFAMAIGPDGKLYLGGSPTGNIYVDGKVFCKTGQSYIWDLLFDDKGYLYAATGPDGKLFRIDRRGRARVILDSSEAHLMCLARDSKGNVYAGTSDKGIVYRIDPRGESTVIYDAAEGEIRALAVDEADNLYVGTADVKPPGGTVRPPVGTSRAVRVVRTAASAKETTATKPTPAPPRIQRDDVTATNAVYRISPRGAVIKLHAVSKKMVMSLLWHDGRLYVGTGNRGDLIAIDGNLDVIVLEKDLEGQVLSLAAGTDGELLLGSGDEGRLIRYAAGHVGEGEYVSEVFDAKFPARFGTISWMGETPAGTKVEVTTRSGNVAEPDASWSPWSKPYGESGENVKGPAARFIQCRLRLKTGRPKLTPRIDEVRIAYLTGNQPPRVKSIKIEKPQSSGKAAKGHDPKIKISWQVEDPNGDKMSCRVEFRRKGAGNWRVLEEKVEGTNFTWDTDAVPDGRYEVRVTASDAPANPQDSALEHTRVSEALVVDNTRPRVTLEAKPGRGEAVVEAALADDTGILRSAEYTLDSGDWTTVAPDDLIFDAKSEKVTLTLKDLAPGEHTLTLRTTDDSANTGAGSVTFVVRR